MTPEEFADNYAQEKGYDDLEQFTYEIEDYQEATLWIKNLMVAFAIYNTQELIKSIKEP